MSMNNNSIECCSDVGETSYGTYRASDVIKMMTTDLCVDSVAIVPPRIIESNVNRDTLEAWNAMQSEMAKYTSSKPTLVGTGSSKWIVKSEVTNLDDKAHKHDLTLVYQQLTAKEVAQFRTETMRLLRVANDTSAAKQVLDLMHHNDTYGVPELDGPAGYHVKGAWDDVVSRMAIRAFTSELVAFHVKNTVLNTLIDEAAISDSFWFHGPAVCLNLSVAAYLKMINAGQWVDRRHRGRKRFSTDTTIEVGHELNLGTHVPEFCKPSYIRGPSFESWLEGTSSRLVTKSKTDFLTSVKAAIDPMSKATGSKTYVVMFIKITFPIQVQGPYSLLT